MGTAKASKKSARLETRLSQEQKELIERAAAYAGRTVSDFVVAYLEVVAKQVVEEYERMRLDKEQSQALVAALLSPERPNKKLHGAMAQHRQRVESR